MRTWGNWTKYNEGKIKTTMNISDPINGYPVLLRLQHQRCLVVGGGKVATRKVSGLLEAGAHVIVVSPQFDPALQSLADIGRIEAHATAYADGMIAQYRPLLVFAATHDPLVNQQVMREAAALNILTNRADNAETSTFTNMAAIQRDAITIGIATNGASAALSAHLRTRIAAVIGEEYVTLVRWLAQLRPLALQQIPDEQTRSAFWRAVITSPILDTLRAGDESRARALLDQLWAEHSA
jgi:siroheme synthase-like protein